MKRWFGLTLLILLAGCKNGVLEDPNDPKIAGVMAPDVLRRQLKGTSDMLMERVTKGELSDAQFKELIAKRANELLDDLPIDKIDVARAWEYGEVLRTAERWKQAKALFKIAVDEAIKSKNENRRVNDTLHLAHVEAKLGEVPQAIKDAQFAFDAKPDASAPILPAVLLEIVPAARGKGHDPDLAKLLEKAIAKHMATIVDPTNESGAVFLMARSHHVRNAWATIIELYAKSGMDQEAREAVAKREASLSAMKRV